MLTRLYLLLTVMLALASGTASSAQSPAVPQNSSTMTIHAETRLVLVDAVVTNKKGVYQRDLKQKDFKVYEDGKEQAIKSFSFEADPTSPTNSRPHYMVLFFDISSMELTDQMQARQAAVKFIDTNAGPNRFMAIVNFGGALQVAQNFTADPDLLKRVVAGQKLSSVNSNPEVASLGVPVLSNAELEFGQYSTLRALRAMAKNLANVPGRKILVFLSAGFPVTADLVSDLTATIDACNKANVAIYPIDVRGLMTPKIGALFPDASGGHLVLASLPLNGTSYGTVRPASWNPPQPGVFFQRGGGGGRPGGGGGGGVRPSPGGGGRPTNYNPGIPNMQRTQPRIIPTIPPSAMTNQQVFYALASGTGGFVIVNTNDLVGGLEKIAAEQNEYYVLGYSPDVSAEGTCHTLKVTVDRGDTVIRARSGYCNVKPVDLLAGNPVEKELQSRADAAGSGTFQGSITAPFFYVAPNVARVDVSMEIPPDAMKVEKEKGQYHATVNVLGVAVTKDGNTAARFSDAVKLDFEGKKELEEFAKHPFHYEKQFEAPAGSFNLKVVFSSGGDSFGKLETPLVIDPNNGKEFTLSGIMLSNKLINLAQDPGNDEDALLEDRTPIIVNHMEIVPSADNRFKKADLSVIYVEIYEPLLKSEKPPVVAIDIRALERKSGAVKYDSGFLSVAPSIHPGNPVIPVGLKLLTEKLDPGLYRLEIQAKDSTGWSSLVRTADFQLE